MDAIPVLNTIGNLLLIKWSISIGSTWWHLAKYSELMTQIIRTTRYRYARNGYIGKKVLVAYRIRYDVFRHPLIGFAAIFRCASTSTAATGLNISFFVNGQTLLAKSSRLPYSKKMDRLVVVLLLRTPIVSRYQKREGRTGRGVKKQKRERKAGA